MFIGIDGQLLKQARKGMYSVDLVNNNGEIICDVKNKNGEHLGFCKVGYVDMILENNGIMEEIKKEYKRLCKIRYRYN